MSKNNFTERLRKMEPRKDHYSIRKFSVGVASVLIGFSFLGLDNTPEVKAETTDQPQSVETNKSGSNEKKATTQDSQKNTDQDNVSANNENEQPLDINEKLAVQALKNRSIAAAARKDSNLNISESAGKVKADIGLSGLKDTDAKSQTVKGRSEKNSTPVDKNTDAAKKTVVKADGKSDQAVNEKSTDTKDKESDSQTLTIKNSDIKSGKADQADELAKELNTDLTTDKSGKNGKLSPKGVDNKLVSGTEQTLDVNKTAGLDVKNQKNQVDAKKLARLYGNNLEEKNPVTVSNWQGFVNAMNDANDSTINLDQDINVGIKNINGITQPHSSANSHELNLTGKNIARNLTINGNGHAINFGDYYLSFDTNNQQDGTPWNLVFKNIKINAKGYSSGKYAGAFSPFYMGGDDIKTDLLAKNKVTFDGVTADVKNGAFYATTMAMQAGDDPYTTVTFEGTNNITCESVNADVLPDLVFVGTYDYSSAVMASHIIFAEGTNTTFNVGNKQTHEMATNAGGNILRAKVEDSKDTEAPIIVEEGATVNLNVDPSNMTTNLNNASNDVRGILVNNAISGTVVINGKLNANMGKGHSSAILAGNLEIGKNGIVNIITAQDNQTDGTEYSFDNGVANYNGVHYAPISLGVGFGANVTAADSHLTDNGILKIIRDNKGKTLVPLIAFGTGGANGVNYNMTVGDGATLDLQDNSTTFDGLLARIKTRQPNTPPAGLITMFGGSSTDNLIFNNPYYVNFQRNKSGNDSLRGNFIRLEGKAGNSTWINGPTASENATPVAQWDEGNFSDDSPSFVWYIKQLHTQNQWGDYANSFTTKGQKPAAKKGSDTLLNATDNSFIMATNQAGKGSTSATNGDVNSTGDTGVGYKTNYLNQFGNHFSWWLPQRLAMGTKLLSENIINDSQKYQPEAKTIDGTTNQKLSDLKVKDGIKDLIGPDGNKVTDLSSIDWDKTHWYNSTTDKTEWQKQTSDNEPTNPTGNLKLTDTSAVATVVYKDNSIDFVTIPLKITAPDSDTYDSHYQGTKAEKGKETDVPKPTIKNSSNGSAASDEVTQHTSYSAVTTGNDQTPSWVTVNSDGSLILNPGDKVDVGMKNIPIQVKYGDGSSEITDAPVYVSDGDHSIIWGHDANGNTTGAVVLVTDPSKLNAHETSDNSQVLTPADAVTGIEEYTVGDNGKATFAGHLDKSEVKITWTETPSTVVTTPSKTGSTSGALHVDLNGQANTYLGNDSNSSFDDQLTIPTIGAVAKNPSTPVNVGFNTKLTKDEFNDLVDNNIPADEIAGYAWHNADGTDTLPEKATTATIRITFKDKDKNGNPTYLDIKLPANSIKVTSDADHYTVAYGDMKIARPNDNSTNSESEEPTVTTSPVPSGTISNYAIDSSFTSPTGVTIIVDKNGKITATANKNAVLGSFKVPVNVTYADTSTAKVNVTVSVTGFDKDPHGGQTHYYGDQTMLTFGLPVITVHKTTGTNIYDASQIKFDTIYYNYNWSGQGYDTNAYNGHTIYKLNADGTKYVNEDDSTDTFNASDLHTSWRTVGGYTYQADTDESKFSNGAASTKYKNEDGSFNTEEQTAVGGTLPENLAGNSKYRFNFSFEGSDVPSGIEVPDGIWSNVYFNFLGVTGKTDNPVNVGDTVPTDATGIEKYLASNDVGTPSSASTNNKWQVTNISWEANGKPGSDGKFDASHKNGIVRFDFKDADGKTSYLDVKVSFKTGSYVPHNNNNDNKNDDTNLYVTRTIHYDVPAGETAVPDAIQSVHYIRDGYKHLGADGKEDGTYIWNAWKLADGETAKFPEIETVHQFTGYDSYVNKVKGKTVDAADVIEDKDKTPQDGKEVTITYVKQDATPIKYDPKSTDANMTVHRHITYDVSGTGHAAIDSVDQTVDYIRKDADGNAGYKDPVTGKITYVAWNVKNGGSASFPEINPVVQIAGYDSYVNGTEGTTVAAANVAQDNDGKPQNADNITITYKASDQSVKFEFWDDTDNKEIGSDHAVNGTTNQTVTTNLTAPDNYDLAQGTDSGTDLYSIPASYKFGATNPSVIKIHFVHGTETITHDKPSTTIKGAEASDLTTKVTRKVTINTPATDGQEAKSDIKNQEVNFGRSVKVDKVTGKIISYSDWQVISSNSTLAEVDAPTVAGYTPTANKADEITPKAGDKAADVTINYTANDQSSYYKFVDDDNHGNQVGNNQIIEGKTDQAIDLNISAPEHYILTPGQTIPTKYTFKARSNDPLTIHLQHKVDTIDPNKPTNPDKIPAGAKNSDGSEVTKDNFSETIKRTITAYIPATNGVAAHDKDLSETTTLYRTGNYDEITKTMTYNPWSNGSFAKEDAPEVAGYTPSQKTVEAVTDVTDGYKDPHISITYSAGSESVNFTWVDDDEKGAKVGSPISVSGDTDHSVNTGLRIPDGYELAGGKSDTATDIYNNIPSSYTFHDSNPDINIHLKHKIDKKVTKIPTGGAKNPDGSDVKDTDFSKDVKRTITAEEPQGDGTTKSVDLSQTVTIHRTGNYDEVTKKMTWNNDWSTDTFKAVNAPQFDGYTSLISGTAGTKVASDTAKDGYTDPNIMITYTANNSSFKVVYQDKDGHSIDNGSYDQTFNGKTDETVGKDSKGNSGIKLPAGWEVVPGTTEPTLPAKYSLSDKQQKEYDVKIQHKVDTIDPNKPTNPDNIPAGAKNSNGSAVTKDNFSETIKRTITVIKPDGTKDTSLSQSVSIHRTGNYDEVTKTMTYNSWSTGKFDVVTVPTIDDYTPSQATVPAVANVTDGYKDPHIVITYSSGDKSMSYIFVDDDNKEQQVGSTIIMKGTTGKLITPNLSIPSGYQLAKGQKLPVSYTFKSSDTDLLTTIHLVHAHKIIEPNEPGVDPKKPQYSDMFTIVKRDIEVTGPDQTTPVNHQQSVKLERSKTIDLVTNEISYGKWQLVGTEIQAGGIETYSESPLEFPEWAVPQHNGYTSYVGSEASETVPPELINKDNPQNGTTVYVTYRKIDNGGGNSGGNDHPTPQGQITINYVDQNGNVVSSTTISGTEGQTTDPSNTIADKVPNGYKIKDGFDVPTSAAFSSTITVPVVKNADQGKDNNKGNGSKPTSTPTSGNNGHHSSGNNGNRKPGNKHSGNTGKHRSGSSNLPYGESTNGRLGTNKGRHSGGNLAPLGENNGHGQNGSQNGAYNAAQNASHNAKMLPQTGENSHKTAVLSTIGMLGLTAAGIVALLALGGDRKRR